MVIQGKRIRKINRLTRFVANDQAFIVGIRVSATTANALQQIGFTRNPEVGDSILPRTVFGPVSTFNADGKFIVHKDQPMEERVTHQTQWTWTQWRGRYQREERTEIRDVTKMCYPRTFVDPPAIEFTVVQSEDGTPIVAAPQMTIDDSGGDTCVHVVNLFLEVFGKCEIFSANLEQITIPEVRKLNWTILPQGRRPWPQVKGDLQPIIDELPDGSKPVIEYRFETINRHNPDFVAIGEAGFRGYVVFSFTDKNLHVLESAYTGNATYVFRENWEALSRLTKAEILNEGLQHARVIHLNSWTGQIQHLLR